MQAGRSEFARPASLALMAIAAVGWLVAAYFWAQAVGLRADGEEAQRRAEVARQEVVGELQNLQRLVGSATELRQKLDDGRKALDDAVSQRTIVQGDLADLTRKVDETELSLASETDLLDSKSTLLKDTEANLKTAQDELAEIAAQKTAAAEDLQKAQAALADATARAQAADASAVAAKSSETASRAMIDDLGKAAQAAKARLDDLEARIDAAQKRQTVPLAPAPSPTP